MPGTQLAPLKSAKGWLLLAAGTALFLFLFSRVPLREYWAALQSVQPAYVALTVMFGWAATGFRTLRFGLFFPPAGEWLRLFGTFAVMRPVYAAMPFQSGELLLVWYLKRAGFSPSLAMLAPVWVLLRIGDVLALGTLIAAAALGSGVLDVATVVYSAVFLGFAGAAGALAWWWYKDTVLQRLARFDWVAQRLEHFQAGLSHFHAAGAWLRAYASSMGIWLAMVAATVAMQQAFNSPLPLGTCAAIAVFALAAGVLPVHAPLGIGTTDAVWTSLMVLFGLPLSQAIVITLGIRILYFLIYGSDGLLGLALLAKRSRTRRQR